MILVRNTFQVHPGRMKDAVALVREGRAILARLAFPTPRFLTDVTGEFFTLVMETQFENLQEFESKLSSNFSDQEWQAWYQRFLGVVRRGRRDIFRIVD